MTQAKSAISHAVRKLRRFFEMTQPASLSSLGGEGWGEEAPFHHSLLTIHHSPWARCAICFLALTLTALAQPTVKHQEIKTCADVPTTSGKIEYLLYLPKEYASNPTQHWPLILFLHGSGERGTNVFKVTIHGPPRLVQEGRDFPFIIASPQCGPTERWNPITLSRLLDQVEAQQRVDKSRIYLTGLSMGGSGTWTLAFEHPDRFAAIAPICGGGDPAVVERLSADKAAAGKGLGIWVFHGEKDPTVPIAKSEKMIEALKTLGCKDVAFTRYPEALHDSWTVTYNNPKLYDWFLSHQKK